MKQPEVVITDPTTVTVLPATVIQCSSPPCYAHEVDPMYMGISQTEPQDGTTSPLDNPAVGCFKLSTYLGPA